MVDFFCSEYGWTVDQVFDHSIAELELLITVAKKRKQAEAEYDASLHQMQIKKSKDPSNHQMSDESAFERAKGRGWNIEDV